MSFLLGIKRYHGLKVTGGLDRSPTHNGSNTHAYARQPRQSRSYDMHGSAPSEAVSSPVSNMDFDFGDLSQGSSLRPATRKPKNPRNTQNYRAARAYSKAVAEGSIVIDISHICKRADHSIASLDPGGFDFDFDFDGVVGYPTTMVQGGAASDCVMHDAQLLPRSERMHVRVTTGAVAEGWSAAWRMGARSAQNGSGYYDEEGERTVHGCAVSPVVVLAVTAVSVVLVHLIVNLACSHLQTC